jgi:hypothetical protein
MRAREALAGDEQQRVDRTEVARGDRRPVGLRDPVSQPNR